MKRTVVLFDLDGTLLDTGPGIMKSAQYALRAYGIERDWHELGFFVGPPLDETFTALLGAENAAAATAKFREYYNEKGWLESAVYDGITECLDALRRAGKRLCVATSKPEVMAIRVLERAGLLDRFETVCGAPPDDPAAGKKICVIRRALQHMGCAREDAVMVGDRRHDIAGGKEADIGTMGVLYGYGSLEELQQAGADEIAATPLALAQALLRA